jgi:D-aminopeptidase
MRAVRARDLDIIVGTGRPGRANSITDVGGVRVGHCTLVAGATQLIRGTGPVRTGVTVVLPPTDRGWVRPVFAAAHVLNGNGEMTGLAWVRESGLLTSPVGLTNTHSVGVVRDELVALEVERRPTTEDFWALPVVGETWDGRLNDCNGFHVRPEHVRVALADATDGPVAEGNVGGGTGMVCHGFKGGIGTASRLTATGDTVGVLVQANHGSRRRLSVNGVPVGHYIDEQRVPVPQAADSSPPQGAGSIIGLVATDVPLLPHQCRRLAQRSSLGVARLGGLGEHSSGDLFVAFATGNELSAGSDEPQPRTRHLQMLADEHLDALFEATVEATEEAILNALVAAETMTGRDGITAYSLPHDMLVDVLDRHGLRKLR